MDKFNIKSILLGIGIGIIITCISSMIYFAGTYPTKEPSEQDVARLAEKYGLIKATDNSADSTGIFLTDTTNTQSKTK